MKAEVIKVFIDKEKKTYCKPGDIVDFEEARVKSLIERGLVKAVAAKSKSNQTDV